MSDPWGRFQISVKINLFDESNVLAINEICKDCFVFEYRELNKPWTIIEINDNNDISMSIVKLDNYNGMEIYIVTLTVQSIRRANGGYCKDLNANNTRLFFPDKLYEIRVIYTK